MKLMMIALAIFGLSNIYAQEEINYYEKKNELNVQIDDVFARSDYFNLLVYADYYDNMGGFLQNMSGTSIGIGYKFYLKNGAIRAKAKMGTTSNSYTPSGTNKSSYKYLHHSETFSAGYEFHKKFDRILIFSGVDVSLSYFGLKYDSKIYNGDGSYKDLESKYAGVSYGIKPFLGFKYYILPQFSVSTEYYFLFERYINREIYDVKNEDDTTSENIGFKTSFGPQGQITFSFHF